MRIPPELVDDILRERCVLFIGSGVSQEAGLPGAADLGYELARKIGYSDPYDALPRIAQDYYIREGRSKVRLFEFLDRKINVPHLKPSKSHNLVARTERFRTIVTTNWDRLLETTLKDCVLVKRDTDLSFADPQKRLILKIHGCITDRETMVVTEDDYDNFGKRDHDKKIAQRLATLLGDHTFLFLGYSLRDKNFEYLYEEGITTLRDFGRPSYAVLKDANKAEIEEWRGRKVHIICGAAEDFLTQLCRELGGVDREKEIGLVPFQVASRRPGIEFCGIPGVGKTELLKMICRENRRQGIPYALVDLAKAGHSLEAVYEELADKLGMRNGENFLERLRDRLTARERIMLLFDATERASTEVMEELGKTVLSNLAETDSRLIVILAGRKPVGRLPYRVRKCMRFHWLEPLSSRDTRNQIEMVLEEEFGLTDQIYELSCGHPLCTDYLAQQWAQGRIDAADLALGKAQVMSCMLEEIVDPKIVRSKSTRKTLMILSPLREFDPAIARQILRKFVPEYIQLTPLDGLATIRKIKDETMLVYSPEGKWGYVILEPLRQILVRAFVLLDPQRFLAVHHEAVRSYEDLVQLERQLNRSAYLVEWLYHKGYVLREEGQQEPGLKLKVQFTSYLEQFYFEDGEPYVSAMDALRNQLERDSELKEVMGESLSPLLEVFEPYISTAKH